MKILPRHAMVRDRGAAFRRARINAGASFHQRGSRPEVLPGSTSRGGRRQQRHPRGKGKKEKKMSFALKGRKLLFPPAGWLGRL